MSAEPWRRSGTPVAPRLFAWQAWYFGDLRLDLCGRCGTLETFVDVCGTLATKRDPSALWIGKVFEVSCIFLWFFLFQGQFFEKNTSIYLAKK